MIIVSSGTRSTKNKKRATAHRATKQNKEQSGKLPKQIGTRFSEDKREGITWHSAAP